MSDSRRRPGEIRIPFLYVPRGQTPPAEWLAAHPGAIRIPARMVPRPPEQGGGQQIEIDWDAPPDAPASPPEPLPPFASHRSVAPRGPFREPHVRPPNQWPRPPDPVETYFRTEAAIARAIAMLADAYGKARASTENDPTDLVESPRLSAETPSSLLTLAASGDLKCQGFSAGCQAGGSYRTTGTYYMGGKLLCTDCAVKMLGVQDQSAGEKLLALRPFTFSNN